MTRNRHRHSKLPRLSSRVNELVAEITQHLYHRSIQIRKSMSRDNLEDAMEFANQTILDWIEEQRRATAASLEKNTAYPQPKQPSQDTQFFDRQMRLIAHVGTGLWRLRQKLLKPESDQPLDEVRRAYRHFQSVWDAIEDAGFTIQDHTNQSYDAHLALKVVAFEPNPNVQREIVSETIKPSIYYQQNDSQQVIQMGEVIVATPVQENKPSNNFQEIL